MYHSFAPDPTLLATRSGFPRYRRLSWPYDRARPAPPEWRVRQFSGPGSSGSSIDRSKAPTLPPTPALFNINAIDFDYDPAPEPPERWIRFLEQLWGDDLESVKLLQEWMEEDDGYDEWIGPLLDEGLKQHAIRFRESSE